MSASVHPLPAQPPFYVVQALSLHDDREPISFLHETLIGRAGEALASFERTVDDLLTGQHDRHEIEAIWKIDPVAGTVENATAAVLARYVRHKESWDDGFEPLIAQALDRYGVPYRQLADPEVETLDDVLEAA